MLAETEEEYYRRGHYERIFPHPRTLNKYKKYFESIRYTNALTWKFLEEGSVLLDAYYSRDEYANNV